MKVNFEMSDATRPIISVKKGAEAGAKTVIKLDGKGRMNHRRLGAIQKITKILENTEGFTIVRGTTSDEQQETGESLEQGGDDRRRA